MVSKDMKLFNPKKVGSKREPLSTQLWQCILLLTLLWVDLLRIILLFITNNEEDIRFSKLIEFIPNRGLYILETNP